MLRPVAGEAGGNDIAPRAASAARHRHDVVHGELIRRNGLSAIMADASPHLLPPPIGLAQVARLRPFSRDMGGILADVDPVGHACDRARTQDPGQSGPPNRLDL